ncbi:LOW QUALITY PROTEIN: postacrosomal sheath WW domain-binding protein [Chlorocebus sabaeus]|uniref:LOW QUALITY PROTEIN: postacrosomal sheath WW domain-binding protein n=1 Tax=Chlorocebus sabaeus TaxID=60711 RepID=UPI00045DB5A1
MAVNQSHTENRRGVLIPNGESLLKQSPNVELSFPQQSEGSNVFSGTKTGTLFLTSYRVIFITSRSINDPMLSFMMPFDLITNLTVEQPVFAANFIKGTIQAAPYGGWEGQATFKLVFRNGGAIEFAQLMVKAASSAARGFPLRTLNDWFSSMRIYVITGKGIYALHRCLVQLLPMEPHLQDMEPHLPDMEPHLQDMEPHLPDMGPHLQDMEPNLQEMKARLWDTEPHLQDMELHLLAMKPHLQEMKACLRDTEPHLLDLEPGLTNLQQPRLLKTRLLFPLPPLLRSILNLLRCKP